MGFDAVAVNGFELNKALMCLIPLAFVMALEAPAASDSGCRASRFDNASR